MNKADTYWTVLYSNIRCKWDLCFWLTHKDLVRLDSIQSFVLFIHYPHIYLILSVAFCAGKSYGMDVVWMDSTADEAHLWQRMLQCDGEWVEDVLPLRMLVMAKNMSKWDCIKHVDKCVETLWEHTVCRSGWIYELCTEEWWAMCMYLCNWWSLYDHCMTHGYTSYFRLSSPKHTFNLLSQS